jgi:hypothetical protein
MLQFQMYFIIVEAWTDTLKMLKLLQQSLIFYGEFVYCPPISGVLKQHVLV